MGITTCVCCTLLLISLHVQGSFSQKAPPKRDEDRGNLYPGRVILYRPVASNRENRRYIGNQDREGASSEHSRRYNWERDRIDVHERERPFDQNKQTAHSEQQSHRFNDRKHRSDFEFNQPYREKERITHSDHNRAHDREQEPSNYPRHNRPFNRDKERKFPEYNRPFDQNREQDYSENRRNDKDHEKLHFVSSQDKPSREKPRFESSSRERPFRFRTQRFDDHKFQESQFKSDNVPTPQSSQRKEIQSRNGFLFPGENDPGRGGFWSPRPVTPYNNVVDYIPRERHRFQNNLPISGYSNDNVGFKHKSRPALLQGNVATGIPIPGSGIIVASGPGGVRHVIHDLRVPVHTHIHHNGDKIPQTGNVEPFRSTENKFPTVDNNPYNSITQAYKGVPIYIQGESLGPKEYDPRFIALYRQVLEENQKKLIPLNKEKEQSGFQSSPTYEWFSEPDPLYHPRNSALIILPHVQLTTGLAYEPPTAAGFQNQEHSTIGTVQLPISTEFITELHSTTGTAYEEPQLPTSHPLTVQPANSPVSTTEQLIPPIDAEPTGLPKVISPTPETATTQTHTTTKETLQPVYSTEPTMEKVSTEKTVPLEDDIYRLSAPFIPKDTLTVTVTEKTQPTETSTAGELSLAPDPVDEVISTSVSHSVSAIRLTRERTTSNSSEILQTSHLTPPLKEQLRDVSTPHSSAESIQERVTLPDETSTISEEEKTTTEVVSNTVQDSQLTSSKDSVQVRANLTDEAETTIRGETETVTRQTATQTDTTDSTTLSGESTTEDNTTQATTTASDLALTTFNYLVLSLVNQVRANNFLSENVTTPVTTSSEET